MFDGVARASCTPVNVNLDLATQWFSQKNESVVQIYPASATYSQDTP